ILKVKIPDTDSSSDATLQKLATDAAKCLDYSVLNNQVKEYLSSQSLTTTLQQLEIEVFEESEVKIYMEQKLTKIKNKERAPFLVWLIPLALLVILIHWATVTGDRIFQVAGASLG